MRIVLAGIFLLGQLTFAVAQTSTVASGNWSEATSWSNGVPAATTTATVTNPLVLDQNISITSGDFEIYANVTDPAGTPVFLSTLTMTGGTLDIRSGITTFE